MFKKPMWKIHMRSIYGKILHEITVLFSLICKYTAMNIKELTFEAFKHYFVNWKVIYFMQWLNKTCVFEKILF